MSDFGRKELVIGTRGSLLARAQTQWVVDRIKAAHPGLEVRTEIISTAGDRDQTRPIPEIGTKGLFTVDLENALLGGTIDLAVHSAKDLQSVLPEGLAILAYPVREDPRDAWVGAGGVAFDDLPAGSIVGTSSLRRQAQLRMRRSDLRYVPIRGNVDTRINKVHRGDFAGTVLAMAGVKRAGLAQHVTHPFDPAVCLPAPAQGALALEGRVGDTRVIELLRPIADAPTAAEVECERGILAELDAGCRAPLGILARCSGEVLNCQALVADPLGQEWIRTEMAGTVPGLRTLIENMVTELIDRGAEEVIARCRE